MMLGGALGVIGIIRIHLWGWMGWFIKHDPQTGEVLADSVHAQEHYHLLAVSIGVAVVGVVLWGTVIGAMLPFLLKKMRLDPATSSAPFVATLVDVVGVIIYFSVAAMLLKGAIL